jgi:membrane-associated phospholipid phosphatase
MILFKKHPFFYVVIACVFIPLVMNAQVRRSDTKGGFETHLLDYQPLSIDLKKKQERMLRFSSQQNLNELWQNKKESKPQTKRFTEQLSSRQLILGTLALTAASFSLDIYMRQASRKQRYDSFDWWFDRTNRIGENDIIARTLIISGISGLMLRDRKLQQATLNSMRSLLIAKPATSLVKQVFGRSRPRVERGNMHFAPSMAKETSNYRAFSSGHTASAWALVTPYAEAYSRWLYILPFSTGIARMYKDRHWASDVVAGTILGFFTGYTAHHGERFNFRLTGNGFRVRF